MTGAIEGGDVLSLSSVWIIDDGIPLETAPFPHERMMAGRDPIDRTALLQLAAPERWSDEPLQDLCRELGEAAKSVAAFLTPAAALAHLQEGGTPPDAIVFDLSYVGVEHEAVIEHLTNLLDSSLSLVQVYTHKPADEASGRLDRLLREYPGRLSPPKNKQETNALVLSRGIAERLRTSLSMRIANRIRVATASAVEKVLVRIDDLPLKVALQALVGEAEIVSEEEFLELMSIKVSEALEAHASLPSAVRDFMIEKGVPGEHVDELVRNVVSLVTSHVREEVRGNGRLLSDLKAAWASAPAGAQENREANGDVASRFVAFQLYGLPTDDIVRSGDIVRIPGRGDADEDPPDLYLVVAPACDMARFWKKTRGALTVARLCPAEPRGRRMANAYSNRPKSFSSVTAQNPMMFPSVPVAEGRLVDYVLFIHEISFEGFENLGLIDVGGGNKQVQKPLAYSETEGQVVRVCRLSEPYLAGVLGKMEAELFQFGVPDFPDPVKERIKSMIAKPTDEK